jgi:hypothetical protein
MANHQIKTLPIALRVFPEDAETERGTRSARFWQEPEGILILSTQPRGKRGLIGSYRVIVGGECVEEGMFYDGLSKVDVRVLKEYVVSLLAETGTGNFKRLQLLTFPEFLKVFYELAYKARCLVVGFNLPVHLSQIAYSSAPARGFFAGGFSLGLWSYIDKRGRERPNGFRPRICVKYVDRKRALIAFTARNSPDEEDLIPEGSISGEPRPGYRFPGHFLDLRTIAFALTDEDHSLEAVCESFGIKHGKKRAAS